MAVQVLGLLRIAKFARFGRLAASRSAKKSSAGGGDSVSIRLRISGLDQLQNALIGANPTLSPQIISKSLRAAAFKVQRRAVEKEMIRGDKTRRRAQRRRAGGARGRFLVAPPHPSRVTSRTGTLARSIGTDFSELSRGLAHVGPTVRYGPVHELGGVWGGRRYPVRAYLQPAAEHVAPKFGEIVYRNWVRSTFGR